MRYRLLAAAIVLLPGVASAAPRTFQELANLLVTFLDAATGMMIVAGIVIYFFGISTGLVSPGESSQTKLKVYITWGLIVLFVMVSIWGILRMLQSTLFSSDPYSPSVGGSGFNDPFVPSEFAE
jgi:predicted membrane channel-forming protein YqfA (hemolysin III family)